jgi:alkylhydroperoxidase family enzyme
MNVLFSVLLAMLHSLALDARFPSAKPDDAWAQLPRENPALPAWALVLVKSLPRTTGAMLELDRLHRADNPIGPVLAAKLRWLAADAIQCDYARASAMADLKRFGASADEIRRVLEKKPTAAEQGVFTFAWQVTKAAYAITDSEFEELLKEFGPEKMTAIIHTLAFANFQNRIIMALGVKAEPESPPPLGVKLDAKRRAAVVTPARPDWERVKEAKPAKTYNAPAEWKEISFAELEKNVDAQKSSKIRVPLPDPKVFADLNADVRRQTEAIVWTKVCAGYQPVMTQSWFVCLREFQQEAKLNRVFGASLFWVVTRANDCFY